MINSSFECSIRCLVPKIEPDDTTPVNTAWTHVCCKLQETKSNCNVSLGKRYKVSPGSTCDLFFTVSFCFFCPFQFLSLFFEKILPLLQGVLLISDQSIPFLDRFVCVVLNFSSDSSVPEHIAQCEPGISTAHKKKEGGQGFSLRCSHCKRFSSEIWWIAQLQSSSLVQTDDWLAHTESLHDSCKVNVFVEVKFDDCSRNTRRKGERRRGFDRWMKQNHTELLSPSSCRRYQSNLAVNVLLTFHTFLCCQFCFRLNEKNWANMKTQRHNRHVGNWVGACVSGSWADHGSLPRRAASENTVRHGVWRRFAQHQVRCDLFLVLSKKFFLTWWRIGVSCSVWCKCKRSTRRTVDNSLFPSATENKKKHRPLFRVWLSARRSTTAWSIFCSFAFLDALFTIYHSQCHLMHFAFVRNTRSSRTSLINLFTVAWHVTRSSVCLQHDYPESDEAGGAASPAATPEEAAQDDAGGEPAEHGRARARQHRARLWHPRARRGTANEVPQQWSTYRSPWSCWPKLFAGSYLPSCCCAAESFLAQSPNLKKLQKRPVTFLHSSCCYFFFPWFSAAFHNSSCSFHRSFNQLLQCSGTRHRWHCWLDGRRHNAGSYGRNMGRNPGSLHGTEHAGKPQITTTTQRATQTDWRRGLTTRTRDFSVLSSDFFICCWKSAILVFSLALARIQHILPSTSDKHGFCYVSNRF